MREEDTEDEQEDKQHQQVQEQHQRESIEETTCVSSVLRWDRSEVYMYILPNTPSHVILNVHTH